MISAQDVKKLRDMTGAGMMDCKKALVESEGNIEAAIDYLRKKGQKVSAKRADRDANEGVIVSKSSDDHKTSAIVEVNCETDFVARNEDFLSFAQSVTDLVLEAKPADNDALLALDFNGMTLGDAVTEMVGKIGEKIQVRRFHLLTSTDGTVVSYIHPGSKLGVLVEMDDTAKAHDAGRDIAMQVAAMNPVAAKRDEVDQSLVQKEMEIARDAAIQDGKPENIVEKIATGKVERYFKDHVLVEQAFVKDSSQTVGEMLKANETDIRQFVRFALGG